MIYQHTVDDFALKSEWSCLQVKVDYQWVWRIVSGPTTDTKTLQIPVALPADAVISRAWLSFKMGSPNTGAAVKTLNDVDIPYNATELDVEGITPASTVFSATFSFRAYGAIIQDTNTHSSQLRFEGMALNIEYDSDSQGGEGGPEEDEPAGIQRGPDAGAQRPRLLDRNLRESARLDPGRLSLNLQLTPLSTATMTLPDGSPEVRVRDFVELFDPNGSVGIFRVTEVDTNFGATQTCYLEHAFTTLADSLCIGVQGMSGPFSAVISALLDAQTVHHWILGDVELPDEYEVIYEYRYDNLMTAILDLTEMLPEEYAWELDTLHYPWIMHLRKLSDEDFCECRLTRNMSSVSVTVDSSEQCTRIYPFGAGEGTDRISLSSLTGSLFLEADNVETWGVINRTFTDDNIFDSVTLQTVAEKYLERHKEPLVSVEIDAEDLFSATGESLDRFRVGRLCRLPMHQYGTIMRERVISISYPDVYGRPQRAVLTLANRLRSASDEIADLIRDASSSKLIGGKVKSEDLKGSSGGITTSHPYRYQVDVTEYGNLLALRLSYTCIISTSGDVANCSVSVDGNKVQEPHEPFGGTVDLMPYLERDESGIPIVGTHTVLIQPTTGQGIEHYVTSTITMKTIEKK